MKEINRWFEFAREDSIVAQASFDKGVYNQVCFHAHQGVEKALKGYLADRERDIPKTHFIGVLLKLCVEIDGDFEKMVERCIILDDYYIPTRYPDALPGSFPEGMPDKEDALKAMAILKEAMDFVEGKIL